MHQSVVPPHLLLFGCTESPLQQNGSSRINFMHHTSFAPFAPTPVHSIMIPKTFLKICENVCSFHPGQQTALGLLCKSAGNVKEFTLFYRLNGSQDIFIYFWMGGRPISREESSEFLSKKLWIFSQATPVSQVHSKHHLGQSLTAQELWICHYQLTLEIIFRCDSISL